MKRRAFFWLVVLSLLVLAACALAPEAPVTSPEPAATAVTLWPATSTLPVPATMTLEPTVMPTDTPTLPAPSATPLPTATVAPLPPDLALSAGDILLYPAPYIYAGDQVTFQVLAHVPENVVPEAVTVHVLVGETEVASGVLGGRNLAGEAVSLFQWAWDTTGMIGVHEVFVILDRDDQIQIGDENPDNNQVTLNVTVQDPATLSRAEANATWVLAESACCYVHVVSGTAAYRDLHELLPAVDRAAQQAVERLGEEPQRKFDVYFIDRIIGQGGYAGSAIVVSYLDRDYAGVELHQVLVHEAVHLLDRQFAPRRIVFLAEGVAVWASDGHYKPEDIDARVAALMEAGLYLPLDQLIDNFYPVQHEIGYLQAAGLVSYLINNYGWPRFRDFYSAVTPEAGVRLSEIMDQNLQHHYGQSLAEVEAAWLAYLQTLRPDSATVTDLETTLHHYTVMRRYQMFYDPTAYFLTAWLPYPREVQESGNTADLTRRSREEINVTLEVMLQAANDALRAGDYMLANVLLNSVSRVLDHGGTFIDPLAINYLKVVRAATDQGYEVQRATLNGNAATVLVSRPNAYALTELNLVLRGQEWMLAN